MNVDYLATRLSISNKAALTRRDAFGLVLLAGWAQMSQNGTAFITAFILCIFIPQGISALGLLGNRLFKRLVFEGHIILYPVLLISAGYSLPVAYSEVLTAAGAGWLTGIALQRLVNKDLASMKTGDAR